MARLKGKMFAPTRKQKAREWMRRIMIIVAILSVINCGRMLINAVVGPMGKAAVVAEFGGEEAMAQMSKADLQRPYFAYVNGKMDAAWTPIGKIIGFFDNIGCLFLMWHTSKWLWGVKATVGFTLGLFYEMVTLATFGGVYYHFYKIANEQTKKKPAVDIQKEMKKQDEAEAAKAKKEEEKRKAREKDPNQMSEEAWRRKQERIMNKKRQERWEKARKG